MQAQSHKDAFFLLDRSSKGNCGKEICWVTELLARLTSKSDGASKGDRNNICNANLKQMLSYIYNLDLRPH